ncbi:M16 family metallopeptidase [Spongiivirga citrea]|uniref:Insulinase family protein n=1 Tax=Spongiivirga citrea TaxID=1481457 RepID=A0A6M0CCN7_9FLAO|nr:M16 family metallopeptidase [Spongiivirga citrea]NER15598.1 insulinase family protein [Spongiivirga citrea]
MKFNKILVFAALALAVISCDKKETKTYKVSTQTDANGYSYETVENDPTGLRLYTLDNGLKVYLSKNEEEPKIQTFIPVRAGSKYDPADNTGLAHYLEHMVFKGTDEIGTTDYEAEKVYLDQIKQLYEDHKAETDPEKKKAIYKKIDEVSQEASKISIANEYDKMVASLGAEGTNAWTSFEETVYVNKIPSNELDKWLKVESERFSQLVLRLFHTEIEAVYEEFNRGQDSDGRKKYFAVWEELFPTHPYGTQTTIGTSDHLKNPSLVAIQNYFDTYYVPNNMAVVMVGDLDYDETIQKVDKAFGGYKSKEVTHPVFESEAPITAPKVREVFGPTAESVYVAYRTEGGLGSENEKYVYLIDFILANSQAGLIDLNLNQSQKVQRASSFTTVNIDNGVHFLDGTPKADQTLEEVKDLLLSQIEEIKKGNFEDWMIDAVVNDLKLSEMRQYENASSTAFAYVDAFTKFQNWSDKVKFADDLKKITKQELVDFANNHYNDNYVIVYKRKGLDENIAKVENPGITPVQLNRDKQSDFIKAFNETPSSKLTPKYVDYASEIKKTKTKSGLEVAYIENKTNDLFNLNIIFDMGRDNDKKLATAIGYLEYLGTDKYSPEELKKEFYKLGINYYVSAGNDKSYVGLSGLKENLSKGLDLLEHLWSNAVADQETYNKYVAQIDKRRQDNKLQKGRILQSGLMNYAKYGENSRLRDIIQTSELKELNPEELVDIVKDLRNFKQRVFYYGKDVENAVAALDEKHSTPETLRDYAPAVKYEEKETGGNVYFANYDMVQAEMMFVAKSDPFSTENLAASRLFNTYFGAGLSSIVFQEIRESKSLAYSAYSFYSNARKKDESNYVMAYIGTQANKMPQAVDAMLELMNDMPESEEQFQAAKEATLKKLASERITKSNIFWNYERLQNQGINHDVREDIYNAVSKMTMDDLKTFFNDNIKGEDYNMVVIGNRNDVDMKALEKMGKVQEMNIDYLFNYELAKKDIEIQ